MSCRRFVLLSTTRGRRWPEDIRAQLTARNSTARRPVDLIGELCAWLLVSQRNLVQRPCAAACLFGHRIQNRALERPGPTLGYRVVGQVHARHITVLVMASQHRFGHFFGGLYL